MKMMMTRRKRRIDADVDMQVDMEQLSDCDSTVNMLKYSHYENMKNETKNRNNTAA